MRVGSGAGLAAAVRQRWVARPLWCAVPAALRGRRAPVAPAGYNPARCVSIYTKTGDKGRSSLFTGERRRKDDAVFQALGDIDELTVAIGVAREYCSREPATHTLADRLTEIQCRLLDVGSHVATPPPATGTSGPELDGKLQRTAMRSEWVAALETWIDEMDSALPPLTNFILPSGGLASLSLHQARSICRRAERSVVTARQSDDHGQGAGAQERGDAGGEGGGGRGGAGVYLNRLSDFLFVAARHRSPLFLSLSLSLSISPQPSSLSPFPLPPVSFPHFPHKALNPKP
eukprot:Tamp_24870.p1 GENE.Tamp_24870~~Tamp_24870.p1  ORF type:complete len:289 (+),score=34.97 Tamp_24870:1-867(+)